LDTPPEQPSQSPLIPQPNWEVDNLTIVQQVNPDGPPNTLRQTLTWKFTDMWFIAFPDPTSSAQYRIGVIPAPGGTFQWVDQPMAGGDYTTEGYSGGPVPLPPMCLEGTVVDDPTQGFVLNLFLVGPYGVVQPPIEYTVDDSSGTVIQREVIPTVVPLIVDNSGTPPDQPLAIESLVRATQNTGASIPFHIQKPYDSGTLTIDGTLRPLYEVKLIPDTNDLNPLQNPQTNVKVQLKFGGLPYRKQNIYLKVCTDIGTEYTDGHIHDSVRTDPCSQGSNGRPQGLLDDPQSPSGVRNPPPEYYPLLKETDDNGEVNLTYTSPKNITPQPKNDPIYISGNDKVTAWLSYDENTNDEQDLKTWVQNLSALAGSENCAGTNISFTTDTGDAYPAYYFVSQQQHGCLFYGTDATNASIASIANAFVKAQLDRQNGNNASYGANQNGQNFNTPLPPKPLRITAMSLPWGGLCDIKGNWDPRHLTHNNGRCVDIGLADFVLVDNVQGTTGWDMDRILLLKAVIQSDPNFGSFPVGEGGDLGGADTTLTNPLGPHIHVNLKA